MKFDLFYLNPKVETHPMRKPETHDICTNRMSINCYDTGGSQLQLVLSTVSRLIGDETHPYVMKMKTVFEFNTQYIL
jgi:hypothetical protein